MNRATRVSILAIGVLGIIGLGVHLFAASDPETECIWDYQDNPSSRCSTANNVYCTIRCTVPECANTLSTVFTGAKIWMVKQVEPAEGLEWDNAVYVNCYVTSPCRYGTNLREECKYSGSGIWVCDESDEDIELCHRCYPIAPSVVTQTYYAELIECDFGG